MNEASRISHDRLRGALLGLATGDALGAAVEFMSPGTFKPVTGFRSGGPWGLAAGQWTDDTSMALALADSLAKAGWSLHDQAERYVNWWRHGEYSVVGRCFDIGGTTRAALSRFEAHGDPQTSGDRAARASGNGSIMRFAPVPIRYAHLFPGQIDELSRLAAESSLPTHASPQCLSACRYLSLLLCGLMHGLDRQTVLSPDWPALSRLRETAPLHPEIDAVAAGSFRVKEPPQIVGSGYVVASLEAALWAFDQAADFRDAVLRSVNLGDDADTTGAICGQLAGAHWGESGIPAAWLAGLDRKDLLETALAGLLDGAPQCSAQPSSSVATSEPLRLATKDDLPPADRCYWVVPDRLLAGGYPGSPTPEKHRARIEALWNAGIRTFISLMEAHETSKGKPFTPYDTVLQQLSARDGESFKCLRFPVQDVSIPTHDGMREILEALDAALGAGQKVYLHCFGGIGRTGIAVCCWLLQHSLATPDNVLEKLRELRQADLQRADWRAPENDKQEKFVMNWLSNN